MIEAMDEDFAYFYEQKGFGPQWRPMPVPDAAVLKFKDRLPEKLMSYWRSYGWSGYANGLFWVVDPDAWEPVVEAWIGDTPLMERDAYYVIARSAFGKLFLWGTKSGRSLMINGPDGTIYPKNDAADVAAGKSDLLVRTFFSALTTRQLDRLDTFQKPLFDRAVERLGPIASDEMYGFEPALAVGGKADLRNLRKLKAVEHLVVLAQLGERKIMRDIAQDARSAGLL